MTRMELRVFRYGLLAGMVAIAGALVFASVSWGTMSSPHYGGAYEFVEATLTMCDGAVPQRPHKEVFMSNGAGSRGVYVWRMDKNPAIEHELDFKIVPPRWRRIGANSVPIAIVSPETATSCYFRLCVEFTLVEVGKPLAPVTAIDCRTFHSGTTTSAREVTLGPVPGVSTTLDPTLHGRIFRNSTHGADTCSDGLWVHTIGVAFEKDRPGSRTALQK